MNGTGPNKTKRTDVDWIEHNWPSRTKVDWIRPNLTKWTELDHSGPRMTKLDRMDWIRPNEPKWTGPKVDWIGPNKTRWNEVDLIWPKFSLLTKFYPFCFLGNLLKRYCFIPTSKIKTMQRLCLAIIALAKINSLISLS